MVSDPVRQGHYAARITVKQGYSRWGYNEDTELVWDSNEHEGDDYYYAWSTLFPSDWVAPSRWGIFLQWHAKLGTSPPLSFDARQDTAVVYVRGGQTDGAGKFQYSRAVPVLRTLSKGKWNDFVVHVHWSASNGTVEVWNRVAGESQFTKTASLSGVPTLQRTDKGTASNYTLWGLYRGSYCPQPTQLGCTSSQGTQSDSTLYEDGFTRGTSFDDVARAAFGDAPKGVRSSTASRPRRHARPAAKSRRRAAGSAWSGLGRVRAQVDSGCRLCRVGVASSTVSARIGAGADSEDTAVASVALSHRRRFSRGIVIRDRVRLGGAKSLGGNVVLLQVRDAQARVVCELYAAGRNRVLRIWSPPGSLSSSPINLSTRAVVPIGAARALPFEVRLTRRRRLEVMVYGRKRLSLRLGSDRSRLPAAVRFGIDHYDGTASQSLTASHKRIVLAPLPRR